MVGHTQPQACLVTTPTTQSILFAGRYISLKAVSVATGMQYGFLSKILSGHRDPSISSAKKIAKALGMSIDALLDTIEKRRESIDAKNAKRLEEYSNRIRREDDANLRAIREGRAPVPPIPGTRAS